MLMDVATPTKVGCSSWEIANVALKKEDSTVRFTTTMYSLFGNFSWRIDGESSLFGSGHSLFCGVVQTPLREEEGHDYWSKWICGSSHCSAAHPQRHDMPDHWISFGVGQQIAERRRCEPIESQIVRLCHFNAGHCSEGERWMAEASVHCDWHRSYVLCHGDWRYESVTKILFVQMTLKEAWISRTAAMWRATLHLSLEARECCHRWCWCRTRWNPWFCRRECCLCMREWVGSSVSTNLCCTKQGGSDQTSCSI